MMKKQALVGMLIATLVLSDGIGVYAYGMEGKSSNSLSVNVETANSDLLDNYNNISENVSLGDIQCETVTIEKAAVDSPCNETAYSESAIVETCSREYNCLKVDTNLEVSENGVKHSKRYGSEGFDSIILETLDDAKKNALGKHKNCYKKSILSTIKSTKWILNTRNVRQTYCNRIYYLEYGDQVGMIPSGTCVQVTGSIMAEYYTRKGFAKTYEGAKYINAFKEMLYITFFDNQIHFKKLGNGEVWSSGTEDYYVPTMYEKFYQRHNNKTRGFRETDVDNLYSFIKNTISFSRPVHGGFVAPDKSAHAMSICGAYEITVEYKEKKKGKAKTKKYVYLVVNDGAKDCDDGNKRVQYIQKKYLDGIVTLS
ncbi:hypothetical protein [Eubacterium xylanophilum]|uniref:hypothetical protein n=1 Tax=Eubacterium xylanophilum TaxID=39497 RepID=UPI0012EBA64D|nr:hypothetical protein [Eubacterium xylanophilum]